MEYGDTALLSLLNTALPLDGNLPIAQYVDISCDQVFALVVLLLCHTLCSTVWD